MPIDSAAERSASTSAWPLGSESLIERSASARASATGGSTEDVLRQWAEEEGLTHLAEGQRVVGEQGVDLHQYLVHVQGVLVHGHHGLARVGKDALDGDLLGESAGEGARAVRVAEAGWAFARDLDAFPHEYGGPAERRTDARWLDIYHQAGLPLDGVAEQLLARLGPEGERGPWPFQAALADKVLLVVEGHASARRALEALLQSLGAQVVGYDIRPAVKEQVESLGAKFVELDLDTGDAEDKGEVLIEVNDDVRAGLVETHSEASELVERRLGALLPVGGARQPCGPSHRRGAREQQAALEEHRRSAGEVEVEAGHLSIGEFEVNGIPHAIAILTIVVTSIYIAMYLLVAMRKVYGQGRIITFLKYIVLLVAYLFGFAATMLGALMIAAFSMT
mgnify:CR=1 FL=1